MKLYVAWRVEPLTSREKANNPSATCAHVPVFASSFLWFTKFMAVFYSGEIVGEALEGESPKREAVDDSENNLRARDRTSSLFGYLDD